jgi:DNA processing protein
MSANPERTLAFLRISLTPGMTPARAWRLLGAIGDPRALDTLDRRRLEEVGLPADVGKALLSEESLRRAGVETERAASAGIRIVDPSDPGYPPLLTEIADPPLVLYVRGHPLESARPHIAIVGSRRPTPYGVNAAERLARDLAERGVTVVSGLARGIDAAAHRGALAGGTTVAILGTGADRVYPAEHASLATAITGSGSLVSEYPLGTLPLPQNFPRRNRLLAGMTQATIVVEGRERSGSLITARLALEANREVFAVPGPIDSPASSGPHQLIRDGACLVTRWEDVARELAPAITLVDPETDPSSEPDSTAGLSKEESSLLEALSLSEATTIDALIRRSSLPPGTAHAAIMGLELRGLVRKLAGERYIRRAVGLPR